MKFISHLFSKNDLIKFTGAKGFEYNYSYNSAGNLTSVQTPRGATNFTVNSKGLVTQVTNPENISVGFVYDSYGNVTQTNAPENGSVRQEPGQNPSEPSQWPPELQQFSYW